MLYNDIISGLLFLLPFFSSCFHTNVQISISYEFESIKSAKINMNVDSYTHIFLQN